LTIKDNKYLNMKNIILIISLPCLLYSCESKIETEQTITEEQATHLIKLSDEQIKNAEVKTGTMMKMNISSTLKLQGKIDVPPQSMISISVPMGGYLKSTNLLNGMYVHKGDVIAVMEDSKYIELQQDYLTAKAQFAVLESEFRRQKDLNISKATSDKVFEQTKANYETQLILIKALEEKLKLVGLNPLKLNADNISNSINVYSPITGFVSAVNVNIGKYIHSNNVLFELVDPTDIHLSLTVFEKDIHKLFIGQKLVAYSNNNPKKRYNCEIILVSKNLENDNATEVHCHFKEYDKELLPGMFINAEVEISTKETNVLPNEAIVSFDNKNYVFVSNESNNYEIKEIEIGDTTNDFTEVKTENLSGQKIVIKGAYNLLMTFKNKPD
jgi:membrane fusion protein, heavy metal efflux system